MPTNHQRRRIALIIVGFKPKQETACKYFLLLLNHLQSTFEYEFLDRPEKNELLTKLASQDEADADSIRGQLGTVRESVIGAYQETLVENDLPQPKFEQLIIISAIRLTNLHYLLRREKTSLIALGAWDREMAPPSMIEFLQLLVVRASYSALEGATWNSIHLGTRACIFDFTDNLSDTRLMALVGNGLCSECERAVERDGHSGAADEIIAIARRQWVGSRNTPGTPAAIMAALGYDLFLTKGFSPALSERIGQLLKEDVVKELIKAIYVVLIAGAIFYLGWKR